MTETPDIDWTMMEVAFQSAGWAKVTFPTTVKGQIGYTPPGGNWWAIVCPVEKLIGEHGGLKTLLPYLLEGNVQLINYHGPVEDAMAIVDKSLNASGWKVSYLSAGDSGEIYLAWEGS